MANLGIPFFAGLLPTTLQIGESLDIQNLLVSEFFC